MGKEISLTRSLAANHDRFMDDIEFEHEGVRLTYPGQEVFAMPYSSYIDPETWQYANSAYELFENNPLPSEWVNFLRKTQKNREKSGANGAIDLLSGVFMTALDLPEELQSQVPDFQLGYMGMDLSDLDVVRNVINTMISNPQLRPHLENNLTIQIPDVGNRFLDSHKIVDMIKKLELSEGIFLDLGCGVGQSTVDWSKQLPLTVVGVDRQYHPKYYDPQWKTGSAAFAQADIRELPFADNSIDVAIMENVAHHLNFNGLRSTVKEVKRVLKPQQGLFIIGPQNTPKFEGYRVFRKEPAPRSENEVLAEYSLNNIVNEGATGFVNPTRYRR